MVQFNQMFQDPQELRGTGYSQGVRSTPAQDAAPSLRFAAKNSNRAGMAAFVKGAADLFGTAVSTVDAFIQNNIEEDLRSQIDSTRDEFGVRDAALLQADAALQPPPEPESLSRAKENLSGMAAAYASGRLSESAYWARLESISRQAKTRHPGYVDEIDKYVIGLTGSNPANALRRSLQEEAGSAAAQTDREKNRLEQRIEEFANIGGFDRYPSTRDKYAKGELGMEELNFRISTIKNETAQYDLAKSKAAAVTADEELKNRLTKESARKGARAIMDAQILAGADAVGGTQALKDKVLSAAAAQGTDHPPSPEELVALKNQVAQLELVTRSNLDRLRMDDYSGRLKSDGTTSLTLSDADWQEVTKPLLAEFDTLRAAIDGKDKGGTLFSHSADMAELYMSDAKAYLLDREEAARVFAASRGLYGDAVAQTMLPEKASDGKSYLNKITSAMGTYVVQKAAIGESKGFMVEWKKMVDAKESTPEGIRAINDKAVEIMLNPKSPPSAKAGTARMLFGSDNMGFMAAIRPADRLHYYNMFTSAPMVKAMQDARAQGDREGTAAWNQYVSWIKDAFEGMHTEETDSIKTAIVDTNQVRTFFDPKTLHLDMWVDQNADPGSTASRGTQYIAFRSADAAAKKLNYEIDKIRPILEANGEDPAQTLQMMFKDMGLDPHATKQGSVIDHFLTGVEQMVKDKIDELAAKAAASQKKREADMAAKNSSTAP